MIIYTTGNILESEAEALVNPVNCNGVMGKGLALQFKNKYPEMYKRYRKFCITKNFAVGDLMLFNAEDGKTIICFPTKKNYWEKSKYEYIHTGLDLLKEFLAETKKSVAIPKLGCGEVGLSWDAVKNIIETELKNIPQNIYVYEQF